MKLFAAVLALSSASLSPLVSGECCVPETLMTRLSFADATVAVADNTLHIQDGSMLIKNVGQYQNDTINMRITADEDYYKIADVWKDRKDKVRDPYAMNNVTGEFVNLNIQTVGGDSDSGKTTFQFCIENEDGDNQILDAFNFAVFDLDMRSPKDNRAHERMIVNAKSQGFNQAAVTSNTEIEIKCKNIKNGAQEVYPDCTDIVFHSTTKGVGADNPGRDGEGLEDLTDLQMSRSVELYYTNTACFTIQYHHYCPNDEPRIKNENDCPSYQGGNFQFAGYADLLTENTVCPKPPPTSEPTDSPTKAPTDAPTKKPTDSPTKKPTDSPTKGPTDAPTKGPTDSPTKGPTDSPTKAKSSEPTGGIPAAPPIPDNCYTKETLTAIQFNASTLETNTLHEIGGELLYSGIGTFGDDMVLNLRVTADDGYSEIANVWEEREDKVPKRDAKKNGLNGDFGTINLQTVKGKADSGKGTFEFCIIDSNTNTPVKLPSFQFTVYDADERQEYAKEKLSIHPSQYEEYSLVEGTELEVSEKDGFTVFKSTEDGVGADNPKNINELTALQNKRSIGFLFKDTACFTMTYHHYCPNDQEDEVFDPANNARCQDYAGGNFLFGGNSESITKEQICVTKAPTAEPSGPPTQEPTAATLSPTDKTSSPTQEPTAATLSPTDKTSSPSSAPTGPTNLAPPVDVKSPTDEPTPAPECPSKIRVLKTHGSLDIGIAGAIEIVNTSYEPENPKDTTVTVALTNNWGAQIEKIYYQYKKDHFNEKCYNSTEVDIGETYKEITIQCHVTQPYATFELCLGDNEDLSIFTSEDKATVPQCCHANEHEFSACFNLMIWCTDECPAVEQSVTRNRRSLRGKEGKQ